MSSTDADLGRKAAAALFDEAVAPLAAARRAAGQQAFFPLAGQAGAKSYFDAPLCRVMRAEDFEFPGGGTAQGLVDALAAYWAAQDQQALAAMAPRLKEIADALKVRPDETDGDVGVLSYTMF